MTLKNLSGCEATKALLFLLLLGLSSISMGQSDEPDGNKDSDRGGLLAKLELLEGRTQYAVDPAPRFSPQEIGRAKKITWTGELRITEEGEYRFAVEVHGRLRWKLGERVLFDEVATERVVRATAATQLEAKDYSLTIEFEPVMEGGSLRTFWSGPKFFAEPLHESFLTFGPFQQSPEVNNATLVADVLPTWLRGKGIYQSARCAACHHNEDESAPRIVSDLGELGPWLRPDWIAKRLSQATRDTNEKMPAFKITNAEAQAIAKAIGATNQTQMASPELSAERAAKAEALLTSTGCLACHAWKDIESDQATYGGDLTKVGEKWTENFFQKWLSDPKAVHSHAKMPKPALSQREIAELSALLASTGTKEKLSESNGELEPDVKQLVATHRCATCHLMPESLKSPIQERLMMAANFEQSCLGAPTPEHPGYRFSDSDAKALRAFVAAQLDRSIYRAFAARETTPLEIHGCTECHARGKSGGLKAKLMQIAAEAPERFSNLSTLLPPSLASIGDKFEESILKESIVRNDKTPAQRPWLSVRMPHYSLSKEELQSLVDHILWEDRVPDAVVRELQIPSQREVAAKELSAAGARLVTTDGFSCTSCHDLGKWKASPAKPEAKGTDLTQCGKRLREDWFYRWLQNPSRISPNMEMPSVQVATPGVLANDLHQQARALWKVLNEPGFTPPSSGALRILAGDPRGRQPIAYLMDVVVADGKTYIKPLVLAFPNQVNVLWDMEENRLARFWIGPAARQYTRGKSWYWQVEGESLLDLNDPPLPELRLSVEGKAIDCERIGQFKAELDELKVESDRAVISHRLHYKLPNGRARLLHVDQIFEVARTKAENELGITRQFVIRGLERGESIGVVENRKVKWLDRHRYAYVATTPTAPEIPGKKSLVLNVMQTSESLVPGATVRRLAIPDEIMPTALAWRPNNKLGVASLRGRIWEIEDKDGDGVEEAALPFTDEFAAPYGLAGTEKGYDILAKGGLYRASDHHRVGIADEVKLLASGWGHTEDYHDWAVGLPSDGKGGYYIAVPCQQDDRSVEAAKYRGQLLHLVPRSISPSDWRMLGIEVVSSGHRFPMGLARRADGELFVTDNQGNYNPFNELNHVAPGKFFGFVNQLDKKAKLSVPKLDGPSINLPHPWTRSVNGICFLESPPGKSFGPFEGHLVGCEYDTRRLVRMTLQRVGDSFQGAVYPFSREPSPMELRFLGPVSCAVSPRGELYVGSMKDSGWGAGNNVGEVFQIKFAPEKLPAGIREVTAESDMKLVIEFHGAIDAASARDASHYRVESYTRVSTPAYGGEDVARRREVIHSIEFDDQSGRAVISMEKLRPGFVYEIHVDKKLGGGKDFFPAEAHFTFHRAP